MIWASGTASVAQGAVAVELAAAEAAEAAAHALFAAVGSSLTSYREFAVESEDSP